MQTWQERRQKAGASSAEVGGPGQAPLGNMSQSQDSTQKHKSEVRRLLSSARLLQMYSVQAPAVCFLAFTSK